MGSIFSERLQREEKKEFTLFVIELELSSFIETKILKDLELRERNIVLHSTQLK